MRTLKEKLADYDQEFSTMKNQELTVRRLKEEKQQLELKVSVMAARAWVRVRLVSFDFRCGRQ